MDVFRFLNPTFPTYMEQGVLINNLKSKMWIERYAEAGEFKFVTDATAKARQELPIGSFVSHVDTKEIMIVENHEINDQIDSNPELVITGRGLETFLENRIVGSNQSAFPITGASGAIYLASDYLADQIFFLVQNHINATALWDPNDAFPFLSIVNDVPNSGELIDRSVKYGTVYERMLELLAVQNLGVKVTRPAPSDTDTLISIHVGVDRRAEIIFSHDTGEITSADYLWSNKLVKNAAFVSGRWVQTLVLGSETLYSRRMMYIDATDIDSNLSAAPTGGDLDTIVAQMQQRGAQTLASQTNLALTKAEVSKNNKKASYRKDFDVGDLITVHGSYDESTTFRISEYVEIEDNTGSSSYPTLTLV